MATWSKERIQMTLAFILFFFIAIFLFPLIMTEENDHLLLSSLFILIVLITFIRGTVIGLICTLFYIFTFGSTLFFIHLTNTSLFPTFLDFPIQIFFLISFTLIAIVLLAGTMHHDASFC